MMIFGLLYPPGGSSNFLEWLSLVDKHIMLLPIKVIVSQCPRWQAVRLLGLFGGHIYVSSPYEK